MIAVLLYALDYRFKPQHLKNLAQRSEWQSLDFFDPYYLVTLLP